MKKIFFVLLCVFVAITSSFLSACGKNKEELIFYNWQDYIDPDVVDMFTEETGISVIIEPFDTNESMYIKVKNTGGYDVILPSDYMVQRMVNDGLLEKLDMSKIPNYSHIDDNFKNLYFDPANEYFVPYMWGTVGILYDSTRVYEPIDSWEALWDERYEGEIFMYNSVRDAMTAPLKMLGYSVNTLDAGELDEAAALLIEQKPLVKAYLGEPVKDKMIGGEGIMAVMYSGDAQFCQFENENLVYTIPKEGSNIFVDGLVIPKTAPNKENAMKFIDFLCRPEIAALNSEYLGYSTANRSALELIDPELMENPIFWATDEEIARCEFFEDLGDFRDDFDRVWSEVLIGN
ncbi:MAG: spermidine/putrescine ABC transporter substrate-binding protein [Clostridiales bacterium]|jgi:spermidine/putrescine transport system substrate-binding protein|nr:spermidine/putrescine ABC transporter substrate-binding protein [Clostridiales bacterium]